MDGKSTDKTAAALEQIASEGMQSMNAAVSQATRQGEAFMETGMKTWQTEVGRYFNNLSDHSRSTMKALMNCKGPFDVLLVEQQWLTARAEAYLDSGLRFAKAFADAAKTISDSASTAVH